MTQAQAPTLTAVRKDLVDRARKLQPLLAANAPRADRERRLPQESYEAIVDSRVFDVWTPRRYGGFEADMSTQVEVLAALAEGDSAAAWVGALFTSSDIMVGQFAQELQDEIWSDSPSVGLCGTFTPAGSAVAAPGGWIVNGEYPYASGCYHAAWAGVTVPLIDSDGEMTNLGYLYAPMSDVHIKDTWLTYGMRGTGSNTLVLEDVFVPAHRGAPLLDESGQMATVNNSPYRDETLYGLPLGSLASLNLIGVPLGIAQVALSTALEILPRRKIPYSIYTEQIQSVGSQQAIARIAETIDVGRMVIMRAAGDCDRVMNDGDVLDMKTRARIRNDSGYGSNKLRAAVDEIMQLVGSLAAAEANPLQRHFRDITTATLHGFFTPPLMAELYGRSLFGLEPSIALC